MFNTIKLRHKFDRQINIFAEAGITISIINHVIKGYEKCFVSTDRLQNLQEV
jgi:hypothetical protein